MMVDGVDQKGIEEGIREGAGEGGFVKYKQAPGRSGRGRSNRGGKSGSVRMWMWMRCRGVGRNLGRKAV
jgi:hypothetical protein